MKRVSLLILLAFITVKQAAGQWHERKGFVFSAGIGAGVLRLSANDSVSTAFSTTIPNFKFGYMPNKRLAVVVLLPGANYKYHGKDRGFESFCFAAQFWVKKDLWILGGTGLTFDAPAFYTVKDPAKAGFYFGAPSFTLAAGYEIFHKKRFAIDLQYRLFIGSSNIPGGKREGVSNMFLIGFNRY